MSFLLCRSGGEVIFVKRQGSVSAEDDGYLLAFVYDEVTCCCYCL